METNQNQGSQLFQLNIDTNATMALKGAASWAKVLAIVGFILGALFVMFGILFQTAMSRGGYRSDAGILGTSGMIVYLIFGIIIIVSSIFALNFANKISAALRSNDQASLSVGIGAVRNYFAFWAILCIIFLLLLLISVVSLMGK